MEAKSGNFCNQLTIDLYAVSFGIDKINNRYFNNKYVEMGTYIGRVSISVGIPLLAFFYYSRQQAAEKHLPDLRKGIKHLFEFNQGLFPVRDSRNGMHISDDDNDKTSETTSEETSERTPSPRRLSSS